MKSEGCIPLGVPVALFFLNSYDNENMNCPINIKGGLLAMDTPLVMGILNVTPDSFYATSRVQGGEALVERARAMIADGAAILDVGGCSTRPTGEPVPESEELARLHAALDLLDKHLPDAVVSIDTYRARVVRECVAHHNVAIINDVSGFEWDEEMAAAVATLNLPYVLTHSVGWAGAEVAYSSFLQDVLAALSRKMWQLRQMGVKDIIIDPGFGFGKTVEQNYAMLAHLLEFNILEAPLLVGLSRKSMITRLLNISPDEALVPTTALNLAALQGGADILRVHDVKEAVQAVRLHEALAAAHNNF